MIRLQQRRRPQHQCPCCCPQLWQPDIKALQAIARRHHLKLIFDAAHGFGTLYQSRPVGSQGDAQVYSLSPTKLLIAGEGGIVATNDDDLAEDPYRA